MPLVRPAIPRRRPSVRAAAAALLALLPACGGGKSGPAAPAVPTPPPIPSLAAGSALTIVSGDGIVPVSGASVAISGQSSSGAFSETLATDTAGRIVLSRPLLLMPAPMLDISAAGFLTRNTSLKPDSGTTVSLWPTEGLVSSDLAANLVYSPSACPADASPMLPLRRLHAGAAWIVVDPSLQDDTAVATHADAAARLNAILGASRYAVTSQAAPAGSVSFTVKLDPNGSGCTPPDSNGLRVIAYTTTSLSAAGEIVGGSINYCELRWARDPGSVTHEMGHTAGFRHSPSRRDVMYCTTRRQTDTYSDSEAAAMSLMLQRRSGNRWPDNDRDAVAPLAAGAHEVFVCY